MLQFDWTEHWWQHSSAHPIHVLWSDHLSTHIPWNTETPCASGDDGCLGDIWGDFRTHSKCLIKSMPTPGVKVFIPYTVPTIKAFWAGPTGDRSDRPGNKQLQTRTNKRDLCLMAGFFWGPVRLKFQQKPSQHMGYSLLLPLCYRFSSLQLSSAARCPSGGYQMGNLLGFSIFATLELLMLSSLAEMSCKWGGSGWWAENQTNNNNLPKPCFLRKSHR